MVYVPCRQAGTLGTYTRYAVHVTQSDRLAGGRDVRAHLSDCPLCPPDHRVRQVRLRISPGSWGRITIRSRWVRSEARSASHASMEEGLSG